MAIKTASILLDATIAFSAGTAKALTFLTQASASELIAFFNGTDFRTRFEAKFTSVMPYKKKDAPNGYSQNTRKCLLKFPKTLANGNITINTAEIIIRTDVETTDAEQNTYRNTVAQMAWDSDFDGFWKSGSLD
jgi:hypothetical protein